MADLSALATRLGERVQPSDDLYKFTTAQLEEQITEALTVFDPSITITDLPQEKEYLVMWRAMSSCYYILAGKHAEQIRFKIENDEYHGNSVTPNYLLLASRYEDMFNEHVDKTIDVNTVTRRQVGTGLKAPYYEGDTP